MVKKIFALLLALLLTFALFPMAGAEDAGSGETPFQKHGKLSVEGCHVVDEHGEVYQLYGMSTHGLAWYPRYVCRETFTALRDEWNTNTVRLAMYTAGGGGYCTGGDQEKLYGIVTSGVDYATELGMYVIVDWHVLGEKTPLKYMEEAVVFFDSISRRYAGQDNVIYEICNEPNHTSWDDVSLYANTVIPVIRKNDPDALIIVGTPSWCQDVGFGLSRPLPYDNILYAMHFYAASHKDWMRLNMRACMDQGLPIIISEFGICDASGNGGLDYKSAQQWKELIEQYSTGFLCWNLANKNESSSVFKKDCQKLSNWQETDLNPQGIWIREWFLSEENR